MQRTADQADTDKGEGLLPFAQALDLVCCVIMPCCVCQLRLVAETSNRAEQSSTRHSWAGPAAQLRQYRRAQDSFNQASPAVTAGPIFAAVLLPAAAHTGFLNESKRTKANAAAAGRSSAYSNAGVGRREAAGGARPAAAQGDAGALYCACAGVPGTLS